MESPMTAQMAANLLEAHGVRNVVASPGSRNAPLLAAVERSGMAVTSVIDERSAGFVALGMAESTGRPVALMCTSGTALLNYAPAVAEAFYRRLPLVVVSADRPAQWIDQDDSQTLNQPGALSKIVKTTVDIPADADLTPDGPWHANRLLNHALLEATSAPRGPVHINVRLDLSGRAAPETPFMRRVITLEQPRQTLPKTEIERFAERIQGRRVMVIAGFMQPDHKLSRALSRLAKMPNVIVLSETIANLHGEQFLRSIDAVMPPVGKIRSEMIPDVVMTVGGALVSRRVKEWVRSLPNVEHWSIGPQHTTVDPFRRLTCRVELDAAQFLGQLATALAPRPNNSDFASLWKEADIIGRNRLQEIRNNAPWCDLKALNIIVENIPSNADLVAGNGTVIRYLQLLDCHHLHLMDCNRGVSGIDGQTSTAVGHAIASPERPVWLITGDTAAAYDSGILLHGSLPANFRMVVIDNGGGAIFRFVKATNSYPPEILEERLVCNPGLEWMAVGKAAGMNCEVAACMDSLKSALQRMVSDCEHPMLLIVKTDPEVSTLVLNKLLNP